MTVDATTQARYKQPATKRWLPILISSFFAAVASTPTHAQTTLNNPLIRPAPPAKDPATLPPGSPPPGRPGDGSAQAKSLQEEVNAGIQRLNAERVPQPLRMLLSSVYVSAISGKTAVLRQPLPPMQQAILAGQGVVPGSTVPGAATGVAGVPGVGMAGMPGMTGMPGGMMGGGMMMGGMGGAPLSGVPGMVNPFATPPPRPTSIRLRDREPFSLQGFELIPVIRDFEVTLLWAASEETQTIVFQSGIESPSLPAYVPNANILERPDASYFNRVQAVGAGGGGGVGGAATGGGATGTGGGR